MKCRRKKICANFQRIIELISQKIVTKLYKIWVWDPGSEIRDPGYGKNLFRIPDPDPQHWFNGYLTDLIDVFCSGPGEAAGVVTANHVQRRGVRLAPCAHNRGLQGDVVYLLADQ